MKVLPGLLILITFACLMPVQAKNLFIAWEMKRVDQIFWRGNKFVNIKLKSASKEKERKNTKTFADSAARYNVRISRKLKLKVPSYRSKG